MDRTDGLDHGTSNYKYPNLPPSMTMRITYSAGCPYCSKCPRCNPNPRTHFVWVYNDSEAKLLRQRWELNKKLEEDSRRWPFYETQC